MADAGLFGAGRRFAKLAKPLGEASAAAVAKSSASTLMDASPSASSSTLMERSTSRLGALLGRVAGEGDLADASKSIETESPGESSSRTMPSAPSENVVTSAPPPSSLS